MTMTTPVVRTSRAVLRDVQAGSMVSCARCDEVISFRARERPKQVICNLYEAERWVGIEHFHANCYEVAGSPYGVPLDVPQRTAPRR